MPIPQRAPDVLGREFLQIRAKLLDVAASLDRVACAEGSVEDDPRTAQIHQAFRLLLEAKDNSAEGLQQIFSLPYDRQWKENLGIESSR